MARRRTCPSCGELAAYIGGCKNCERKRRAEETERVAAAQREAAARSAQRLGEEEVRRKQQEEERQRRLRTLEGLNALTGIEFEQLVQSLFQKDGYTVKRCGGAGDDGLDLVLTIGDSRDVVQCKRWKGDVGPAVVREFYGAMIHAGARHGFIVTTARFTAAARVWSQNKPIALIDGQALLAWVSGARKSALDRDSRTEFDPYAELGIPRNATEAEVKAAYRSTIAKYHPDRVAHLAPEIQDFATRKAKALNRAYEALKQANSWT
jgi:restriction system protein